MTEQEIFERLLPLIEEVTAVPQEKIRMESILMQDLGAESLDLLDLSFLIDETFGVTLEPDDFEKRVRGRLPDGVYEKNGFLTEDALLVLRQVLPEVPAELLSAAAGRRGVAVGPQRRRNRASHRAQINRTGEGNR